MKMFKKISILGASLSLVLTMSVATLAVNYAPKVSAASQSAKQNGIDGVITVGPTSPLCGTVDQPCYVPYQTTLQVLNNGNKVVATIVSDSQGQFSVNLSAGTYTIKPLDSLSLPTLSPQTVRVSPGLYTTVALQFDSGLR